MVCACLGWTPKKAASNLDRSFSLPERRGRPYSPVKGTRGRASCGPQLALDGRMDEWTAPPPAAPPRCARAR